MWQYNELYHHGIKGQKWGVRRFQNQDGTLTRRGRIRYKDYEKAREGTGDTSLDELKTLSKKVIRSFLTEHFRSTSMTRPIGATKVPRLCIRKKRPNS